MLAAAFCGFQGGQERAGFVYAFLEFACGGGIGNYATAGLDVGYTIFDDHGPQCDA